MGAALAGGLQGSGGGHPEGQLQEGMAKRGSALGGEQAAGHRAGDLSVEGLLRPGAPPCEDAGRSARPPGRQAGSLHVWAAAQLLARPAVALLRGSLDMTGYASAVLGTQGRQRVFLVSSLPTKVSGKRATVAQ